ncbi:hypothetical protein OQA88_9679 [Cercophora sp. LCS_1]
MEFSRPVSTPPVMTSSVDIVDHLQAQITSLTKKLEAVEVEMAALREKDAELEKRLEAFEKEESVRPLTRWVTRLGTSVKTLAADHLRQVNILKSRSMKQEAAIVNLQGQPPGTPLNVRGGAANANQRHHLGGQGNPGTHAGNAMAHGMHQGQSWGQQGGRGRGLWAPNQTIPANDNYGLWSPQAHGSMTSNLASPPHHQANYYDAAPGAFSTPTRMGPPTPGPFNPGVASGGFGDGHVFGPVPPNYLGSAGQGSVVLPPPSAELPRALASHEVSGEAQEAQDVEEEAGGAKEGEEGPVGEEGAGVVVGAEEEEGGTQSETVEKIGEEDSLSGGGRRRSSI